MDYEDFLSSIKSIHIFEVQVSTEREGQWMDEINLRGRQLKCSFTEQGFGSSILRIEDKGGLALEIPSSYIEIIDKYVSLSEPDQVYIEVYAFMDEGFYRMTIKGKNIGNQLGDNMINDAIIESLNDSRFISLVEEAINCKKCTKMATKSAVIGAANGSLKAKVMIIAEAPGPHGADKYRIPLYGDKTGNNFDTLLSSIEWQRNDIYVTNAVLCCPASKDGKVNPPSAQEVSNCSYLLKRQIDLVQPKVIVTLGARALEALTKISPHKIRLKKDVATPQQWGKYWVFPLYHTSPIVMNLKTRTMDEQMRDFKALKEFVDSLEI